MHNFAINIEDRTDGRMSQRRYEQDQTLLPLDVGHMSGVYKVTF